MSELERALNEWHLLNFPTCQGPKRAATASLTGGPLPDGPHVCWEAFKGGYDAAMSGPCPCPHCEGCQE